MGTYSRGMDWGLFANFVEILRILTIHTSLCFSEFVYFQLNEEDLLFSSGFFMMFIIV